MKSASTSASAWLSGCLLAWVHSIHATCDKYSCMLLDAVGALTTCDKMCCMALAGYGAWHDKAIDELFDASSQHKLGVIHDARVIWSYRIWHVRAKKLVTGKPSTPFLLSCNLDGHHWHCKIVGQCRVGCQTEYFSSSRQKRRLPEQSLFLSTCHANTPGIALWHGNPLCHVQFCRAQVHLDHAGFVHWHIAWHLFPLLAATITGLDSNACQGWKRSTRQYMYKIELQYLMVHQHPPSFNSRYPQKKNKVE